MPQFQVPAWAKNKLIPTELDRVDLCPEGCNSAAFIKLIKEKKEDANMKWEEIKKSLTPEHVTAIEAEIEKAKMEGTAAGKKEAEDAAKAEMDKKDAEIADLEKKAKAKKKEGMDSEEEAMAKALENCDPVIKAMFEKMQAKEKAAEAAAKIAKEKADTDAAIAKAKELSDLPVEEAELTEVCKAINTMGEHADKIYTVLKAAANIVEDTVEVDGVKAPITKSLGSSKAGKATAWDTFNGAVVNLAKERKISEADATMAIMKEKPELYYAYLSEEQQ